jgi:hypothetical protein
MFKQLITVIQAYNLFEFSSQLVFKHVTASFIHDQGGKKAVP